MVYYNGDFATCSWDARLPDTALESTGNGDSFTLVHLLNRLGSGEKIVELWRLLKWDMLIKMNLELQEKILFNTNSHTQSLHQCAKTLSMIFLILRFYWENCLTICRTLVVPLTCKKWILKCYSCKILHEQDIEHKANITVNIIILCLVSAYNCASRKIVFNASDTLIWYHV